MGCDLDRWFPNLCVCVCVNLGTEALNLIRGKGERVRFDGGLVSVCE